MAIRHKERHLTDRIGWLRAAVLGANDGIVSTASLVLGVAAADATHSSVMVAGIAGLVAGAMPLLAVAMVSVSSLIPVVSATSLVFLAILGGLAARAGGARVTVGAMRVTFWGALAMGLTAGVGTLFGTVA
jgi:vacuolar iron transporter family protein